MFGLLIFPQLGQLHLHHSPIHPFCTPPNRESSPGRLNIINQQLRPTATELRLITHTERPLALIQLPCRLRPVCQRIAAVTLLSKLHAKEAVAPRLAAFMAHLDRHARAVGVRVRFEDTSGGAVIEATLRSRYASVEDGRVDGAGRHVVSLSEDVQTSTATAACRWVAGAGEIATSLAEVVARLDLEAAVALRLELKAGERVVCLGAEVKAFLNGHAGAVVQVGAI